MTTVPARPDPIEAEVVENPPPDFPPLEEPNRWLKPLLTVLGAVAAIGGVVWVVRKIRGKAASAKALSSGHTSALPNPNAAVPDNPWDELDRLVAASPNQQPIEADGDGDTANGFPYVWRVYGGTKGSPAYQAIAMIPDDDGAWSYWGDDPSTPHFVQANDVDQAMNKILAWADTH